MPLEVLEHDHRQRLLVRRGQHHRRRDARGERLAPAADAQAPAIAGATGPGNPDSGCGVDRSFPASLRKREEFASVITAQTVCIPVSSGPVSQQPLRKKPVTGAAPHGASAPPWTFSALSRDADMANAAATGAAVLAEW